MQNPAVQGVYKSSPVDFQEISRTHLNFQYFTVFSNFQRDFYIDQVFEVLQQRIQKQAL